MAISYRQPTANSSIGKGGAAPGNMPFSGVTQPICFRQARKLLDQFRDKMRSLHYALATEKAYRRWIVEFLRFHRDGDQWKHPTMLGKPEQTVSLRLRSRWPSPRGARHREWVPPPDHAHLASALAD